MPLLTELEPVLLRIYKDIAALGLLFGALVCDPQHMRT